MVYAICKAAFVKELLDLLSETFVKTQGIFLTRDRSLFQTLADVSPEQASESISPNGATLAGHVAHISYYLGVLTNCIRGISSDNVDWEASWQRRRVDEVAWSQTKADLKMAYDSTIAAIETVEEWEGEDDIGASLAILAHSAAHLGAIHQALHAVLAGG